MKQKLIETHKVLSPLAMCENWVVLLFGGKIWPKKYGIKQHWATCNISKHFG
jgi:hypothetical protein